MVARQVQVAVVGVVAALAAGVAARPGGTGGRPRPASRPAGASGCPFSRPGMVCVPAGPFLMGSYSGDADEEPPHEVYLDAYLIDRHEVTFEEYERCVRAGRCRKPHIVLLSRVAPRAAKAGSKGARRSRRVKVKVNPKFPVVGISWYDADRYCRSIGKRLPTEAEWEKAARGTDGRRFPWGNKPPTCELANIDLCGGKLAPVGSRSKGASPYGALDMTGNVWEWVADWYDPGFYRKPEARRNPTGPVSPKDPVTGRLVYRYKVLRGGSYTGSPSPLWVSYRFRLLPNTRGDDIGFRCAYSPTPPAGSAPATAPVAGAGTTEAPPGASDGAGGGEAPEPGSQGAPRGTP